MAKFVDMQRCACVCEKRKILDRALLCVGSISIKKLRRSHG